MGFENKIAARHLRSVRGRRQAVLTTAIAVVGVALGVAVLVIVLSVMNGYSGMIWNRQVGMTPHITVRKPFSERIEDYGGLMQVLADHPEVIEVAPFIRSEGFVRGRPKGRDPVIAGVMVRGVDPERVLRTSDIGLHLQQGTMNLGRLSGEGKTASYGMVIGRFLAEKLGASVGTDVFLVLAPKDLLMTQMPPLKRYRITGIFDTGYFEFDSGLVFVSLSASQRDLGWGGEMITGVQLRLKDPFEADRISVEIRTVLSETHPSLFPSSWMYLHGNLFAWIWLQKWASFIVLSLIVVVAGFNVSSILIMNVTERKREIGILKALGVTPRSIRRIFTREGLVIGLLGVGLGDMLGFSLCWVQQQYELIQLSGEVYFIDALPVLMSWTDFGLVSIFAMGLCFLFTLWPARNAASLDPIAAIRFE
ncbi:MAG: ABC transporter permease [bacterium]|nr:ABC transporter permease [bacterium]